MELKQFNRDAMSEHIENALESGQILAQPTSTDLPILDVKLQPCESNAQVIARPYLHGLLQKSDSYKVTLLLAPAGSGKSTLLSQWFCQQEQKTSAWVSLDSGDNNFHSFLSYLTAAIKQVDPSFSCAISNSGDWDQERLIQYRANLLVDALSRIQQSLTIILDDFHLIDDPSILAVLEKVIAYQPANLHWVLSCSEFPQLKLSRLKLENHLMEIDREKLNFSEAEIAKLQKLISPDAAQDVATLILEKTEGWLAGVKLALEMLNKSCDIAAIEGDSEEFARFLAEDLFLSQPKELQDLLVVSSIHEYVHPELCDLLLDRSDSKSVLRLLERKFLIQPKTIGGNWYRYHALFRSFLLEKLHEKSEEELSQIHGKVSQWLNMQGEMGSAIEHSLAAGDSEVSKNLVGECCRIWMRCGNINDIIYWAERVDPSVVATAPMIAVPYTWALVYARRLDDAERTLALVKQFADSIRNDLEEIAELIDQHVGALQILLSVFQVDISCCSPDVIQQLKQTSDQTGDQQGMLLNMRAYLAYSMDDYMNARRIALKAIQVNERAEHQYAKAYSQIIVTMVDAVSGQLPRAVADITRIEQEHFSTDRPANWVSSATVKAAFSFYQGDIATAESVLQDVMPHLTLGSITEVVCTAYIVLARIRYLQGAKREALELIDYANSLLQTEGDCRWLSRLHYERVRILLDTSKTKAMAYHREFIEELPNAPMQLSDVMESESQRWQFQAKAMLHFQRGDTPEALSLYLQLAERAMEKGNVVQQSMLLPSIICCYRRLGKSDIVHQEMNKLLNMAGKSQLVHTLFEAGEEFIELVTEMRDRQQFGFDVDLEFVNRLIELGSSKSSESDQQSLPATLAIEPLTDKELEILVLLSEGLANKKISERTGTTLNTVKWHLKNLFGKLGVANRTEAVLRAQELNLFAREAS